MDAAFKRSFRRSFATHSEVSGETTLKSAKRKLTHDKSPAPETNLDAARGN